MRKEFIGFEGGSDLSKIGELWTKFNSSTLAKYADHACIYTPNGQGVDIFIGVPKKNVEPSLNIDEFDNLVVEYEYPTTRIITGENREALSMRAFTFWTKDHYEVVNALNGGIEFYKHDVDGNLYIELVLTLNSEE